MTFNLKETRADVFARDFEARVQDFYGRDVVPEFRKRRHFYESLTTQQKTDIGCNMENTYEDMKESLLKVYRVSLLDRLKEIKSIRMREGETVIAFANRLKYLLPEGNRVGQQAPQDPGQRRPGGGGRRDAGG